MELIVWTLLAVQVHLHNRFIPAYNTAKLDKSSTFPKEQFAKSVEQGCHHLPV